MKKIKLTLLILISLAVIIIILFNNKSKMQAKTQKVIQKAVPVSVAVIGMQQIETAQSFIGTIAANNDVALASEAQGKIIAVFVNVGDKVSAGTPIVQIDDELKQAAFVTAEANYEKAKKDIERFESLKIEQTISESQIENARLQYKMAEAQFIVARRQLRDTKITSPIAGIVTARNVDIGANIQNGNIVANIVDISRVKVKLNVAEKDVFQLHNNDVATIATDVFPDVSFSGKIFSIGVKGDDAHTYPVEVRFQNSNEQLRAGMFVRVSFQPLNHSKAIAIPREALIGSLKNAQVFVIENNIAKLRSITIDAHSGKFLEVLSGIKEGEIIVTNGQNNLQDNVQVAIVE